MTAIEAAAAPLFGLTERHVLDMLRQRYDNTGGNGQRWAYAEHVRSHAGFDARRTADCIVMDLWPSKGLAFHGHEVKVSRADWLAELRQPEKAAEFTPYMDYWWLVAGDASIVHLVELPPGWGLLAPRRGRLAVLRQARRTVPQPMPLTMQAALLRAVAKTATRGAA